MDNNQKKSSIAFIFIGLIIGAVLGTVGYYMGTKLIGKNESNTNKINVDTKTNNNETEEKNETKDNNEYSIDNTSNVCSDSFIGYYYRDNGIDILRFDSEDKLVMGSYEETEYYYSIFGKKLTVYNIDKNTGEKSDVYETYTISDNCRNIGNYNYSKTIKNERRFNTDNNSDSIDCSVDIIGTTYEYANRMIRFDSENQLALAGGTSGSAYYYKIEDNKVIIYDRDLNGEKLDTIRSEYTFSDSCNKLGSFKYTGRQNFKR